MFLAGQSSVDRDWPYVHPGTDDAWGGRRVHTFRLVLDVATAPSTADGASTMPRRGAVRAATKASRQPTDITEDVIRDICLPMGLVDIKVCAVSDIWSGLKLVIRRDLR